MARWNLADLSKLPAGIQAQIYPKGNAIAPRPEIESPPAVKESAKHIDPAPQPELSSLDCLPVYVPAIIVRHILNNYAGPFYVASNETQRRRVVDHAVQDLATRETKPFQL